MAVGGLVASLTLAVGATTATVSTTNAKAQALLSEFVAATSGPVEGTAQQQADHVVAQLRKYIVDKSKDQARVTRRNARDAEIETEIDGIDW
jgi:hypothetical protein